MIIKAHTAAVSTLSGRNQKPVGTSLPESKCSVAVGLRWTLIRTQKNKKQGAARSLVYEAKASYSIPCLLLPSSMALLALQASSGFLAMVSQRGVNTPASPARAVERPQCSIIFEILYVPSSMKPKYSMEPTNADVSWRPK